MSFRFPSDEKMIGVEWETIEGGFGVAAATDIEGKAMMGHYRINRMGQPSGWPAMVSCTRLMQDIVIGYVDRKIVSVYVNAAVTQDGLGMVVCAPTEIALRGTPRIVTTIWGSGMPKRDFSNIVSMDDGESALYCMSKAA